jgi:two-component system, chemotaxis family, protein-glutamate methylesterase/glutaminase
VTDTADPLPDPSPRARVVVAGASAGGVEALVGLIGSLPADFPCAVLVVLHVSPSGTSVLPAILARAGRLPVTAPRDRERLLPGHVYVAPPDNHLVVEESVVRLSQAPRENGHRPAIDPTMRTAALAYDGGTIGIVLSGSRDDGTAGLMAIKAGGGKAIVQDPEEALYGAMPRSAMEHVDVDAVLPIDAMAPWILEQHVGTVAPRGLAPVTTSDNPSDEVREAAGEGTRFPCPDCGGNLFERREGALERFECSVGHVFSIESLSSAQAEALEGALWAAVRSLEDRAALLGRLADRARKGSNPRSALTFERQAREVVERANMIREAISGAALEPEAAAEA